MVARVMHQTAPSVPMEIAIQQAKDGDPTRLIHWAEYLRYRRNEYENKFFAEAARAEAAEAEVREWEDWSNELATLLPEDAETWPGVNPEGAQESIIMACLSHLLRSVAAVEALADKWERETPTWLREPWFIKELRAAMASAGRTEPAPEAPCLCGGNGRTCDCSSVLP